MSGVLPSDGALDEVCLVRYSNVPHTTDLTYTWMFQLLWTTWRIASKKYSFSGTMMLVPTSLAVRTYSLTSDVYA